MPRRFFFHYNKPQSKEQGKTLVTLHAKGKCYIIEANKFFVKVPTEGKVNKRQPHFVMQGFANEIVFVNGHTIVK